MTIAEPTDETMDDVDWDALSEVTEHAAELFVKNDRSIPLAVWRALWEEARRAVKGHDEQLDTLRMYAPAGWKPPTS